MHDNVCVLCVEALLKPLDHNLINGKKKGYEEEDDLLFIFKGTSSPYICKRYVTLVKK